MKYSIAKLYINLVLLLLAATPCHAIKVGKGRISLVDIGTQIKSAPAIAQKDFINVYPLSADIDKDKKTVIAIQGLQDQGETSFFVDTLDGIKNFKVELDQNSSETEFLDTRYNRIEVFEKIFNLKNNSSMRISSPYYINDYVLAGDPSLIKLDPFSDYYDENYLKNFIINAQNNKAKTDIIVPTTRQIFKFSIQLDDFKGGYDSVINLI